MNSTDKDKNFALWLSECAEELNEKISEKCDKRLFLFCNYVPIEIKDFDPIGEFWYRIANLYKLTVDCGWLIVEMINVYNKAKQDALRQNIRNYSSGNTAKTRKIMATSEMNQALISVLENVSSEKQPSFIILGEINTFLEVISVLRTVYAHNVSSAMGHDEKKRANQILRKAIIKNDLERLQEEDYKQLNDWINEETTKFFNWCENLIKTAAGEHKDKMTEVFISICLWKYATKKDLFRFMLYDRIASPGINKETTSYYERVRTANNCINKYVSKRYGEKGCFFLEQSDENESDNWKASSELYKIMDNSIKKDDTVTSMLPQFFLGHIIDKEKLVNYS